MKNIYKAAVLRTIRYLDEAVPDWYQYVDPEKYASSPTSDGCPLEQLLEHHPGVYADPEAVFYYDRVLSALPTLGAPSRREWDNDLSYGRWCAIFWGTWWPEAEDDGELPSYIINLWRHKIDWRTKYNVTYSISPNH